MTDKFKKGRKSVKSELSKNRTKGIQELADIKLDSRSSKHQSEPNRYEQKLKAKKQLKRKRTHEKKLKPFLWNRKRIEKRAIVEAEQQKS